MKRFSVKTHVPLVFVFAAGLALTGCSEYLLRHDKLALSAGDAKAHNTAVHMVDPWSRAAFARRSSTDGARAERAIKNYRTGTDGSKNPTNPGSFQIISNNAKPGN